MKHAIYVLLAALGLLLASCKKDRNNDDKFTISHVEGWREIGMTGLTTTWYPDAMRRILLLESDGSYQQLDQDTLTVSGTYNVVTVEGYLDHQQMQGIRFSGDDVTYTRQMRHDTLVLTNNDGPFRGYMRYYIGVPTM